MLECGCKSTLLEAIIVYFVLNEAMSGSVCVMVCGSVCGANVEVIMFVGVSCLHPGACASL